VFNDQSFALINRSKRRYKLSHIIRDFKKFTARSVLKAIEEETGKQERLDALPV